ncbi:hypothetical protein C5167_001508 [Papaver somniferum]|uniref:Uncharacterized protein n=1 Tax=Papaver somniferum TaxID=3469 RepID=A0A4Y7KWV5_PAPSO|nr:hypothetical protein C5167_001508 [Papaver somniferum]
MGDMHLTTERGTARRLADQPPKALPSARFMVKMLQEITAIDDTDLPPRYVNNTDMFPTTDDFCMNKDEPDWDIPTGEVASAGDAIEDIR